MFTELSAREMDDIKAITTCRSLRKGAVLFREGQPSRGFFVRVSGVIKIYRIAPSGREQIMHFVGAGDSFAEATLFNGTYPANAEAMTDCVVLQVGKEEFKRLLARDPQLSFRIIGAMEKWLKRMRERVSELSLSEVPARFATYVLSLPPAAATQRNGRAAFDMTVNKTAVAQMLGTTKETLSRIVHKLRDKRVVNYTGRRLIILNRQKLEKVASGDVKLA
jgi:CRP/FNR family transcriptional regulator